jgi:hypothetical protein
MRRFTHFVLQRWVARGVLLVLCAVIFVAWLDPKNVAAWLMLSSLCT